MNSREPLGTFALTNSLAGYLLPSLVVLSVLVVVAYGVRGERERAELTESRNDKRIWAGFGVAGVFGSLGHYCMTQAFKATDISATQSLRFLDLVWASLLGWLVFGDVPSPSTWAGALVILLAVLAAGFGGWYLAAGPGKTVPAPNVIGATVDDAKATLTAAGLSLTVGEEQYSETVPAGQIISTDPTSGGAVRPGSRRLTSPATAMR